MRGCGGEKERCNMMISGRRGLGLAGPLTSGNCCVAEKRASNNFCATLTMAPLNVQIKHSGKSYNVSLDPELPPGVFKDAIYQVTGVPVDRMKVMIKGGVLKVRLICF